jgi:hypothetical protein
VQLQVKSVQEKEPAHVYSGIRCRDMSTSQAIRLTCHSKGLECASTCITNDAAATHRLKLLLECMEVLVRCAGTPIEFA